MDLTWLYFQLFCQKEIIKTQNTYCYYTEIAYGVPQGLVIFSIWRFVTSFLKKYACNFVSYADDNTPDTRDSDLKTVLTKLERCTNSLFLWFKEYQMKPNVNVTLNVTFLS